MTIILVALRWRMGLTPRPTSRRTPHPGSLGPSNRPGTSGGDEFAPGQTS